MNPPTPSVNDTKKEVLLAIEGYNEEKKILAPFLATIRHQEAEWRLREIDTAIQNLTINL
jgi:hypothetical protein